MRASKRILIMFRLLSLSIKIAEMPDMIGSLGPKALKYESLEAKGVEGTLMVSKIGIPRLADWLQEGHERPIELNNI